MVYCTSKNNGQKNITIGFMDMVHKTIWDHAGLQTYYVFTLNLQSMVATQYMGHLHTSKTV